MVSPQFFFFIIYLFSLVPFTLLHRVSLRRGKNSGLDFDFCCGRLLARWFMSHYYFPSFLEKFICKYCNMLKEEGNRSGIWLFEGFWIFYSRLYVILSTYGDGLRWNKTILPCLSSFFSFSPEKQNKINFINFLLVFNHVLMVAVALGVWIDRI